MSFIICQAVYTSLAILDTRETLFFSRPTRDAPLRQWIEVTIVNRTGSELRGTVAIIAGGEDVITPLVIRPGQHTYRCYGPVLWPRFDPVLYAPVTLVAGERVARGITTLGTHRPWTIYLLSDTCVDYTWAYEDLDRAIADSAAVLRAEMEACRATAHAAFEDQNRYNLVHTGELEFFLRHASPEEVEEWARLTRSGHLTLSPYHNMALTAAQTVEEGIRQFYPARRLEREWGIDIGYANHQETPTITWGQATVLAGCGIRHLVKSIFPYECPWNDRLIEPPLFYWEGPDISRVLVRHRKRDYVEGRFILKGVEAIDQALHEEIIPRYEALGERYPFNTIALVGCYGDLAPKTPQLAAVKSRNVAAYNARAWEYPWLVNGSHKIFWEDIEAQLAARPISVPIFRGDYGSSWEAWTISLASYFAGWRRAQEGSYTADCLAAIASSLDSGWFDAHSAMLEKGWANLLRLSDHAWNGSSEGSRELNACLRREWQEKANVCFDAIIEGGLEALGQSIQTGEGQSILVFNTLGWTRTGIARLRGLGQGPFMVVDEASGKAVPSQVLSDDGEPVLCFEACEVPAMGYRTYRLTTGGEPTAGPVRVAEGAMENDFYSIEVSPRTGGIVSLYDKVRDCELVDADNPYHLNQLLYLLGDEDLTFTSAKISVGACGPLLGQLVIECEVRGIRLATTLTLYAGLDRVDIRNDVHKECCSDREQICFAFPFHVSGRCYRLEAPGAIITPGETTYGGEQRPGSGQAVHILRHFVDVYNDAVGVTLVSLDSGGIQFGRRTQAEAPQRPDPDNSTVLALALGNLINWKEITHDQHGVKDFCFRYSLRGHGGGFDAVRAVRFGAESAQELLTLPLPPHQKGPLPAGEHTFLQVSPDTVILTALKVADEGPDLGVILRLWVPMQTDGPTRATVDISGWGALEAAQLTDLLERDREILPTSQAAVSVDVEPRGLAAVRLKVNARR